MVAVSILGLKGGVDDVLKQLDDLGYLNDIVQSLKNTAPEVLESMEAVFTKAGREDIFLRLLGRQTKVAVVGIDGTVHAATADQLNEALTFSTGSGKGDSVEELLQDVVAPNDQRHAIDAALEAGDISEIGVPLDSRRIHHIASDKDRIYSPQFEELFEEAGLDLQGAWNRTRVANHVGPHGKFSNQYIFERLRNAVAGKSGLAYRDALLDELYQLRREILNGDLGDIFRAPASKADVRGK